MDLTEVRDYTSIEKRINQLRKHYGVDAEPPDSVKKHLYDVAIDVGWSCWYANISNHIFVAWMLQHYANCDDMYDFKQYTDHEEIDDGLLPFS
jgi:hypothetical protein